MKLHELKAADGSTKNRKRRGRGTGTGQGYNWRQRYEWSEIQKRRRSKTRLRRWTDATIQKTSKERIYKSSSEQNIQTSMLKI